MAQVQEIAETFEEESRLPVCEMVGLRANIEFKESINAIIENGNKLPFASLPEPVKLRNNKSARLHENLWATPSMSLLFSVVSV